MECYYFRRISRNRFITIYKSVHIFGWFDKVVTHKSQHAVVCSAPVDLKCFAHRNRVTIGFVSYVVILQCLGLLPHLGNQKFMNWLFENERMKWWKYIDLENCSITKITNFSDDNLRFSNYQWILEKQTDVTYKQTFCDDPLAIKRCHCVMFFITFSHFVFYYHAVARVWTRIRVCLFVCL